MLEVQQACGWGRSIRQIGAFMAPELPGLGLLVVWFLPELYKHLPPHSWCP